MGYITSASRISLQKNDPPASATSSSYCSSMAIIARRTSSNGMFLIAWEFASIRTFRVVECWERSCFYLLFRVSLISTPLSNLLNKFPVMLLPWFLPVCTTLERPLFQFGSSKWERVAPAFRSTPVHWDLTAIKFSPVRYEAAIHCPFLPCFSWCNLILNPTGIVLFADEHLIHVWRSPLFMSNLLLLLFLYRLLKRLRL